MMQKQYAVHTKLVLTDRIPGLNKRAPVAQRPAPLPLPLPLPPAPQGQAESGGMVLVAYAGPVRPAAALRESVLCLPTDIHSLFVNKGFF